LVTRQLASVEGIDEKLDGISQRPFASSEAPRTPTKTSQIVTREPPGRSVITLNREGFALILHGIMECWPEERSLIRFEGVAEVTLTGKRFMQHLLHPYGQKTSFTTNFSRV